MTTTVDQEPEVEATRRILAMLDETPTLAQTIGAARKLDGIGRGAAVRFAILRNYTLEPGLPAAMKVASAAAGLHADIYLGEFDSIEGEAFESSSSLYAFAPDIVVIALRLQAVAPRLVLDFASLSPEAVAELVEASSARVLTVARAVRERTSALVLVHNFEQPPSPAYGLLEAQMRGGQRRTIAALNETLADGLAEISGTYVVDIERLIAELGSERSLDQRYWHIARAPYTFEFQRRVAREYVAFASALKGKAKKCLVLDCDNTLWGGIVGEDGLDGIALGATSPGSAFAEMHSAVLNFYERGVLLAIASKNNEADVLEVLATHPGSRLKPKHFVAKRINWNDKAGNLREIAAELDIGLDSLVFVDDSPFECDLVRQTVPEVTVVELPKDPSRFAGLLRSLSYFDTLTLSAEDRRRSEMYRTAATRNALRVASDSVDGYLASLGMTLTIGMADSFSIPRIAQLTQKTNQFNLTTRRFTEAEIARIAGDPSWHAYYAELSDKFDNAGIIAVALVHDEEQRARVDTFLMSCRVIGRGVEHGLMSAIGRDCASRGIGTLIAEYQPTAKNGLARPFLRDYGFEDLGAEGQWWSIDPTVESMQAPEWFAEIVRKTAVAA